MKNPRSFLTLAILCASLSTVLPILFPVFSYAAVSPGPTPTPAAQPECLRHPGSDPAISTQRVFQAYTTVLSVSSTSQEIDYQISIPAGLLPAAQQIATLVVNVSPQGQQIRKPASQSEQQNNIVIFQPGTQLRILASLKDAQTFLALDVQLTDKQTYAFCKNIVQFIGTPPHTISNGKLIYWQIDQYMLSFDLQQFPVDLQARIATLVLFQNAQPLILSVEKV